MPLRNKILGKGVQCIRGDKYFLLLDQHYFNTPVAGGVPTFRQTFNYQFMNNFKRKFLLVAVCATAIFYSFQSQAQPFESIKSSIKPAVKNGGLVIDSLFLWCPSVIKVGDTYHMFASAWPVKYGMAGWTKYSRCIRATSKSLFGPYKYEETVLEKRAGYWDADRVHNVKITQSGDKYVLYYISTANETGYAEATSITGPWKRMDKISMPFSNPAPWIHEDGRVYVFGRKGVDRRNRGQAYTAPSYQGPYTIVKDGANLLPDDHTLEDPTIWWANNQYNVISTDYGGYATGVNKAGVQYYSKDGITYHQVSKEPINTKVIEYDDGSTFKFKRIERPFVYVNEKGEVLAYFLACMTDKDTGVIVVHPVDKYYPGKENKKSKKAKRAK
jgi:hypothetical protein